MYDKFVVSEFLGFIVLPKRDRRSICMDAVSLIKRQFNELGLSDEEYDLYRKDTVHHITRKNPDMRRSDVVICFINECTEYIKQMAKEDEV